MPPSWKVLDPEYVMNDPGVTPSFFLVIRKQHVSRHIRNFH